MADFSNAWAGPIAGGMFGSETHTGPWERLVRGARFLMPALELVFAAFSADRTGKLWKEYQNSVQRQIDAGLDIHEARTRVAMQMLDESPDLKEARDTYKQLYDQIPAEYKAEADFILDQARGDVDALRADFGRLREGYKKREADVMKVLGDQGKAAADKIERSYNEAEGQALADRASRGLSVAGVGASLMGGFNTRKAEDLASNEEAFGRLKADYLSNLRGDTLGTGFNTATTAYDASTGLSNRRLESLMRALGLEADLGSNYAAFSQGMGQTALDTFLGTTGDEAAYLENITQFPPDTSYIGPQFASAFDSINEAYS